ncbi:hypothetical protein B0H21DRAFT_841415 [Amylocystis lapponica]|nr:hypothetical protein B0H21DRAFT_841415 [Amylocystis lapponica]
MANGIITELTQFTVDDMFSAEPGLYRKLRAGARAAGLRRQSYGVDINNPKMLYWLLHFEDGFRPKDLVWPVEEYGGFLANVAAISAAESVSAFMPLPEFPREVPEAPVTEVEVITLKPDAALDAFRGAIDAGLARVRASEGSHGGCWSMPGGDSRKAYIFVGWDSVECHGKFKQAEGAAETRPVLEASVEKVEVAYVKFTNEE